MRLFILVGIVLWSGLAFGDEFLGFDPEADDVPVDENARRSADEPSQPPPAAPVAPPAEVESSSPRKIGVAGGVNAGFGFFEATLTVAYYLNKYISIDTSGFYYKKEDDLSFEESYGPEVNLVFRLVNPTLVTPFAGAGPGYSYWKRMSHDEIFDESGALTASVFGGMNIALTDFFGIQILRKQQRYLMDPPKSFKDKKTLESSQRLYTSIGFRVFL